MKPPSSTQSACRRRERRLVRKGLRLMAKRIGAEAEEDIGAGLTDVSVEGAGVYLSAAVTVEEKLDLTILRPNGRIVARVRATARWCEAVNEELFIAGVALDRAFTLAELAELL